MALFNGEELVNRSCLFICSCVLWHYSIAAYLMGTWVACYIVQNDELCTKRAGATAEDGEVGVSRLCGGPSQAVHYNLLLRAILEPDEAALVLFSLNRRPIRRARSAIAADTSRSTTSCVVPFVKRRSL
jgi:hypothetical protein